MVRQIWWAEVMVAYKVKRGAWNLADWEPLELLHDGADVMERSRSR